MENLDPKDCKTFEQRHPQVRDYGIGCILGIKHQRIWKVFLWTSVWSTGPTPELNEYAITKNNGNGLKLCSFQKASRHDPIHAIAMMVNLSIIECFKSNEIGTPKSKADCC